MQDMMHTDMYENVLMPNRGSALTWVPESCNGLGLISLPF